MLPLCSDPLAWTKFLQKNALDHQIIQCVKVTKNREATAVVNNNNFYFGVFHILLVTFSMRVHLNEYIAKGTTNAGYSSLHFLFQWSSATRKKFRNYNLIKPSGHNSSMCWFDALIFALADSAQSWPMHRCFWTTVSDPIRVQLILVTPWRTTRRLWAKI